MKPKYWMMLGAISAALAVSCGAFGAHGLRGSLESRVQHGLLSLPDSQRLLETFDTAARYQMYHAVALVLTGIIGARRPSAAITLAGWTLVMGSLLFSGSLYLLVLLEDRRLGMITPFGGLAFIIGWCALAVAAARWPDSGEPEHSVGG